MAKHQINPEFFLFRKIHVICHKFLSYALMRYESYMARISLLFRITFLLKLTDILPGNLKRDTAATVEESWPAVKHLRRAHGVPPTSKQT